MVHQSETYITADTISYKDVPLDNIMVKQTYPTFYTDKIRFFVICIRILSNC